MKINWLMPSVIQMLVLCSDVVGKARKVILEMIFAGIVFALKHSLYAERYPLGRIAHPTGFDVITFLLVTKEIQEKFNICDL